MYKTAIQLLILLATPVVVSSQSPIRIAGVDEPPELTGKPKQVKLLTAAQKGFAEMVIDLGDEAKAKVVRPQLDKFLQEHPGYSDAYFVRAMCDLCTLHNRDYPSILKDVEAAITTHSSSSTENIYETLTDQYSLRGKLKLLLGRDRDAINDLEAAMKVDIEFAENIFNSGAVEPEKESTPCAWNITDLNTIVEKSPKDYRALLLRGLYLTFFSKFKEDYYAVAEQDFQKAAILNPRSPLPHFFIGEIYTRKSFWTEAAWASEEGRNEPQRKAILTYSKAIQLDPNLWQAYEMRASAYHGLKQYTQAIKDYDNVLALDPDNVTAYADRGLANLELGHYLAATVDLRDAIRRKKADDHSLSNSYEHLADAYMKAGMYRDAIDNYGKAIERHLADLTFLLNLKQIRGIYPEYAAVPDEVLCRKIHVLFWPEFEYSVIAKRLMEGEGKWAISLLNDLYEKRGDAYLKANDFKRGVLDFTRIFKGIPNFADTVERWRELGSGSDGEQYLVDVKSMEFDGIGPSRLWLKAVNKKPKPTYTVRAFEFDCRGRRLNSVSSVLYDSEDQVVNSSDLPSGWQRVVPDSMGERLYNGMCSLKQ